MRWGSGKYSSGKYGASAALSRRLSWGIEVAWVNGDTFDGTNEMAYMLSLNIRRGRTSFMKSDGSGFETRPAGNLQMTLKNTSGRFDPFNAGPLQNLLSGNQRVRISVRDESTGTIYVLFTGNVDDIRPDYGDVPTVTLTASDETTKLMNSNADTDVVQANYKYSDAIHDLLVSAGWTGGLRTVTAPSDTMPYWWGTGAKAYDQLWAVSGAILAEFLVDKNGVAVFKGRTNTDTPSVTFTDHDALYSYKIRTPSPRGLIKNLATVYVKNRTANGAVQLWKLSDKPEVQAGKTITLYAKFNYNSQDCPATVVTAPVATTDYTANTVSDGSGTDLTSSFSIVTTVMAMGAKLDITNNSASTGYLTLMKVRGTAITADEYTYAQSSDAESVTRYGEREFTLKSDWLQDLNTATSQASAAILLLKEPKQYPQFMVRGQPAKQFAVDLNDLATLAFNSLNFSQIQRVGYIEHNVSAETAGNIADTTLYFEPNLSANLSGNWTFPAVVGTTTVFT